MKHKYLVNYDYGMGGAWAFLMAESEADIETRFPELTIVRETPTWLTPREAEHLERTLTIDIDDPNAPVLRQILEARSHR